MYVCIRKRNKSYQIVIQTEIFQAKILSYVEQNSIENNAWAFLGFYFYSREADYVVTKIFHAFKLD